MIRQAKPSEYEQVLDFYNRLIDDMEGRPYHPKWKKGIYPDPRDLRAALDAGDLYICEETGETTAHEESGAATARKIPGKILAAMRVNHEAAEGYEKVAWAVDAPKEQVFVLHMLGVAADRQGEGIGKKMVKFAIDLARRSGQKAVRLDVLSGNLPANRLYESMGFAFREKVTLFYEDTGIMDFELYELPLPAQGGGEAPCEDICPDAGAGGSDQTPAAQACCEEPNPAAEAFWAEFCKEKNVNPDASHSAWAFCDGGPAADELLQLVLEGKKFGTASLYEGYLAENEPLPGDREYSVLLNSWQEPVCVVRNFEVKTEPFLRVSEYHGFSEGEEDRNLASWREIHAAYWQPDLAALKHLAECGQPDLAALHIECPEDCRVVEEKFTVEYVRPDVPHNPEILDDFFLIEPNIRYADQIAAYRDEMLAAGSSLDGCLSLKRMPDPAEWVDYAYEWGNPLRNLGENGIRGTLLMMIRKSDDQLVGMIQIHVIPDSHPLAFVGNIGYSVRPAERRKGYAKKMLQKALTYLKYGRGVSRAYICALPDNEASRRTILANGGVFCEQVFDHREGVTLDRFYIDIAEPKTDGQ